MINMVENILKAALLLLELGCVIIWIIALVQSDGTEDCGHDCDSCPFPCEEHNKK